MIGLIGSLCASVIFYGGGLFSAGLILSGLGLAGAGACGLGILLAIAQTDQNRRRLDTREGLSLDQLFMFLHTTPALTGDTKVYVGDQGMNVAGSVFSCLLDGQRTIVIERRDR